jgi:hypothetical protein
VAQTTANADAVLKDYYLTPIREQLNQRSVLMFAADDENPEGLPNTSKGEKIPFKGIARESEGLEFAGRQWVLPAHMSRNEGVGAISEGGTLPTAGQQGWTDLKDTLRHNLGVIRLTRYAIKLSERSPGAFLRLLEAETKGAVNDIRKDVGRQAYGNKTGQLAAVTATGANQVTVDTVQYSRVGMFIDLIDVTNDSVFASNRTITAIDQVNKIITYSGASVVATTNHRLCRTGSWKKEINGLGNLIGNTANGDTAIIHNVDPTAAANLWWNSAVQDGGGNAFSEDLGQQVVDRVGVAGNGEVEMIISTRGVRRRYANSLKSMKRFNDAESVTLHGGFKALMFNEMPFIFDDDCPRGNMFMLNFEAMMWAYLPGSDGKGNWNWVDDDGAVLSRATDRTDAFEAYLAADHDLATVARNRLGKIKNLQDDAALAWN